MSRLKDLFHSRDKPKNYLININPSKKQPIPALPLALADRFLCVAGVTLTVPIMTLATDDINGIILDFVN
jgi:hypothetical protein